MGIPGRAQQQPAPAASADASSWVQYGIERGQKADMDGALAAFDQAIKIDPKCAPAYQYKGYARSLQNKFDEAIALYTQAIQIDPTYQDAYYNRGVAEGEKGDFIQALADFNKTLELNSKYNVAYYNRGHVKYFTGDFDGAIADINQSLQLNPRQPFCYFIRGLTRLAKLDRIGAASDFQQSATDGYAPAALWLWIVKVQSGERGTAQASLTDFMTKPNLFTPDSWYTQVGNFLLGKSTQDQLLATAKASTTEPGRVPEAWFYIGVVKRYSGDLVGAEDCFQKVISSGAKQIEVYAEAQRQLTALQKQ